MGRHKSLGSLTSFLWYTPLLSGTSILSFLRAHHRTGCSLMAARQQLFFPSWVPSGFTSSPSLVSATAIDFDILCLLMWQEIFHFSLATNIGAQETHGRISPNILPSVHFWTTHGHLAGLPCISLSLMHRPCLHIWSRPWIYWGQSPYIICGLHYYPGVSHIVVP